MSTSAKMATMATNPIADALSPLLGPSPGGRYFGRYDLEDGAILAVEFGARRPMTLDELRLLASIAELIEAHLRDQADAPVETSAPPDAGTWSRPDVAKLRVDEAGAEALDPNLYDRPRGG